MNDAEIRAIQRKIGTLDDGVFGGKSRAALQTYLDSLKPSPNLWPKSDNASLRAFYGEPGDEDNLVRIEFPFKTLYEGRPVTNTRCHRKVAASLTRILKTIGEKFGNQPGIMEEASDYGGLFNFRLKRGGSSYSLHAYGAAIDLDADDNTFKDVWPQHADMPLEIMEVFAREGWVSAGGEWGYDAMHFQATQ